MTEPEEYNPLMSVVCNNLGCVVINVGFRNAPEHKCPKGQEDFVDSILHVIDNSSKFGIDPKRVALGGRSGGGWIASGAMNLLIKSGQGHKIKALLLANGMYSLEVNRVAED